MLKFTGLLYFQTRQEYCNLADLSVGQRHIDLYFSRIWSDTVLLNDSGRFYFAIYCRQDFDSYKVKNLF